MTAGMAGSGNHDMNCIGWWWTVEMGNSTNLHVGDHELMMNNKAMCISTLNLSYFERFSVYKPQS